MSAKGGLPSLRFPAIGGNKTLPCSIDHPKIHVGRVLDRPYSRQTLLIGASRKPASESKVIIMRGLRAIIAVFRAQRLLAEGKSAKARDVMERMYRAYGLDISSMSTEVYPHVNLLYISSLQDCGELEGAIRGYAQLLEQLKLGMRWPGRRCNPDEVKYLRCYVRNKALCMSANPESAAFDLAMSVGDECCQFGWTRIGGRIASAFPLSPEFIDHNESIMAAWRRRRTPPAVH